MKLVFTTGELLLEEGEHIELHCGRDNISFALDMSIRNTKRGEELVKRLIALYPYPKYRMDLPIVHTLGEESEVLLASGNFTPFQLV